MSRVRTIPRPQIMIELRDGSLVGLDMVGDVFVRPVSDRLDLVRHATEEKELLEDVIAGATENALADAVKRLRAGRQEALRLVGQAWQRSLDGGS